MKVGKFIITWRDSVMKIHEKVNETQMKIMKHVDEYRTDKTLLSRNEYNDKL